MKGILHNRVSDLALKFWIVNEEPTVNWDGCGFRFSQKKCENEARK